MNIIHKTEQNTAIFSDMDRPRERQRSYDTAYTWNLKKKGTNESIYKTGIESHL